jgi:hypothetical protein
MDICIHPDSHRRDLSGGKGGKFLLPPYFSNLGIVYFVTELNNGKQKTDTKEKIKNLRFMGQIFPLFQI